MSLDYGHTTEHVYIVIRVCTYHSVVCLERVDHVEPMHVYDCRSSA